LPHHHDRDTPDSTPLPVICRPVKERSRRDHRVPRRAQRRPGHRRAARGAGTVLRHAGRRVTGPAGDPDRPGAVRRPAGRLRPAGPGGAGPACQDGRADQAGRAGRPGGVLVPVAGHRAHPVSVPEGAVRAGRLPGPGRREGAHAGGVCGGRPARVQPGRVDHRRHQHRCAGLLRPARPAQVPVKGLLPGRDCSSAGQLSGADPREAIISRGGGIRPTGHELSAPGGRYA
jgi:hypothetical protein